MRSPDALLLSAEDRLDGRDLTAAHAEFMAAEAAGADPDRCAAGRWMVAMLRGDFAAAFRESDAIRARGGPDPHRFWNGASINGKNVIVRCLHGFGDAVQFLRYAPALAARANSVVYEVAPRFVELARCFEGIKDVITWGEQAPAIPPSWDVQIEVMEIPYLFRTETRDLPIAERYLQLPRKESLRVEEEMAAATVPRVGFVWSAGEWNPSRAIPVEMLAPLMARDDCEFWNLQGTTARTEPEFATACMREAGGCRDTIITLAAVVAQLDLVITVDTLAAHLAGALGIPAWVMLQHAADWRWMVDTARSPWYPSLRLFRQPSPGDWASVIGAIRQELDAWCGEPASRMIA